MTFLAPPSKFLLTIFFLSLQLKFMNRKHLRSLLIQREREGGKGGSERGRKSEMGREREKRKMDGDSSQDFRLVD